MVATLAVATARPTRGSHVAKPIAPLTLYGNGLLNRD
jgi:hypothetical protein